MPDAVIIVRLQHMPKPGEESRHHTDQYDVALLRVKTQQDLDRVLAGCSPVSLQKGAVEVNFDVPSPDALEPQPFALTRGLEISSFNEALALARKALADPKSVAGVRGFAPTTPIYEWFPGRQARLVP